MRKTSWPDILLSSGSLALLLIALILPGGNTRHVLLGTVVVILLIIFHLYTPAIAGLSRDNPKVKTMRRLNLFSICMAAVIFSVQSWLPARYAVAGEVAIAVALIVVIGNIAPKLPHSRYMGLRLPWTVRHEPTWRFAHRLLGYTAFPVAALIIILSLILGIADPAWWGILLWVGIASTASLFYYSQKGTT